MSTVTLFSTLAVKGALTEVVLPSCGLDVDVRFDPTSVLGERIAKGEAFDLIIAIDDFLNEQARAGVVAPPVFLASTGVGVAIAPGAQRRPIDTVPQLKAALTSARSVAYSRTGASGIYFSGLIERLGIAAAVNARATILPKGLTGEALLDGRADLAIQQASELMAVSGVELLGLLPKEVQETTRFAVALPASGGSAEAIALLDHLRSPSALEAYRQRGLTPA